MANDHINTIPFSGARLNDADIMAFDKESLSSTPPATHAEGIHQEQPHHDYRRSTIAGQEPFAEHGALVDHKIPQDDVVQSEPDLFWSRVRHYCREPFSEFFGVFILIMFGDGVVAQVVLSGGTKGDYQSISWGWG